MRRLVFVFGLTATILIHSGQAEADWHTMKAKWHAFWDRVHVDWHRNNAWPEPFNHIDRQSINNTFAVVIDEGWKLQNTIPDELFQPETQELTAAGELKVRWILTQMPMHRRSIFVLRGQTQEITETRLRSVEKVAVETLGNTADALIAVTDTIPRGGSGDYLERVNRGYEDSVPPPRLPEMEDASSGGGD